jgi:hypothetical protein
MNEPALTWPCLDVGQEALEGGPIHGAAAETSVVVALGQAGPAFVLLAGDVGQAGFPLRVEAVETLLKPLLGGLARVHGAAHPPGDLSVVAVHRLSFRPLLARRKKWKPLQCVPMMALATALSER